MKGLSGHADAKENLAHVMNICKPGENDEFKIYIKHGEKKNCHALRQTFIDAGYKPEQVVVMKKGESYTL